VVGCGTSHHAGLYGRYAIEEWSGLPVDVEVASEFRYRRALLGRRDLVIGITQSGETADTLGAMRLAHEGRARVLTLTNVPGSQATREAEAALLTAAGLEVSVAATKTFVCQALAMLLLGHRLAAARNALPVGRLAAIERALEALPAACARVIEACEEPLRQAAERFAGADYFLFLGRHAGVPVAMEGALKLKEIAYVPADAYPAGEMKHGPIALLEEGTPVCCVATDSPVLDKLLSNAAEVRARGAHVLAVGTEGSGRVAGAVDEVVTVPGLDWLVQPLLAAVPLQMLSYFVARERGLNVDQPRNLAKTVTVE
jgi:glutamine---fructose-6-phosphate transaminase (isomerizing)